MLSSMCFNASSSSFSAIDYTFHTQQNLQTDYKAGKKHLRWTKRLTNACVGPPSFVAIQRYLPASEACTLTISSDPFLNCLTLLCLPNDTKLSGLSQVQLYGTVLFAKHDRMAVPLGNTVTSLGLLMVGGGSVEEKVHYHIVKRIQDVFL